jgi:putative hemolysin
MSDPSSIGEPNGSKQLPTLFVKPLLGLAKSITVLANVFAKPANATALVRPNAQASEDLRSIVDSAVESGEFQEEDSELIHSVIDFSETVAREIMTPRTDLDAVSVDANPYDIVELISESGHSRIPIYEATDDDIVGVVHAKDILLAMLKGKPINLRSLSRQVMHVPETKNLTELLQEMKLHRCQLVVVKDELGGTSGIVTMEDIMEELVGEIQDEYDDEEPTIAPTARGFLVEGRTHIDSINDELGSNITSEDFDTIGGYVFGLFGRQPKKGEWVEDDQYQFTVADTDGKRILKLRIEELSESN